MPIYEYECRKCGEFEYRQSISDDPLKRCPKCRSAVTKLLSASAFHLKGGGWYSDGYDKKGGATKKKSDSASSDASGSSDKKPSTGSASTPASSSTGSASKKKGKSTS